MTDNCNLSNQNGKGTIHGKDLTMDSKCGRATMKLMRSKAFRVSTRNSHYMQQSIRANLRYHHQNRNCNRNDIMNPWF